MQHTILGRTGLSVSQTSFGALPVQRVEMDEATRLLRRAFDAGINFFDTARAYSDSEEKLGRALGDVRDRIVIATKTMARNAAELREHLETSLRLLRTDYIDILQLHNAETPEGNDGCYAALLDAKAQGKIRWIGITSHRLPVARAAVASGLYDTVQFPVSAISSADDLQLIDDCAASNIGLIAMKALCGGLLTDVPAAFAFLRQFANVVPIWGIQRMAELEQILALDAAPPVLDAAMQASIDRDRAALAGNFCRACGYCLPCPAHIPIPMAARMSLLLRRMPYQQFLAPEWQRQMAAIEDCTHCGHCTSHCPYQLDTPSLLRAMLEDYRAFVEEAQVIHAGSS